MDGVKDIFAEIIIKNLNHSASEDEEKMLQEWLNENPVNKEAYFKYKRLWMLGHLDKYQNEKIIERELERFRCRISSQKKPERERHIRSLSFRLMRYAALFAGLITLCGGIYYYYFFEPLLTYAISDNIAVKEIILNDGTKVYLKSGTTIKFPKSFSKKNRYVEVSGEAFFEVKPDSLHPFIVNLGEVNVRVLGTAFNVKNDTIVETILESGSVMMTTSKGKELAILVPGERAVYESRYGVLAVDNVETDIYTSWRQSQIVLDGVELKEILQSIERNFGVHMNCTGVASNKKYHFIIDKKQKLDNILQQLSFIVPIQYVIEDNNEVTIQIK